MSETVVSASTGRATGSRESRRLRAEGQLPGVIYGLGKEPISVAVSYIELRDALKTDAGLNTIFDLDVDGSRETVLVRTVDRDPIKRTVIHADFIRVDTSKAIKVKVPVHLVGDATAVTANGGLIEQKMFDIEVEATPLNIPNEIEADQSIMTLDRQITVGDLVFPEGVVPQVAEDLSVVAPVIPRAVQEEEEESELLEGEEGAEGEASADADGESGAEE